MNEKLKKKIETTLKKEQVSPTMVYIIYYVISLKSKEADEHLIKQIYLFINRYVKNWVAIDYILDKIKSAYEYNNSIWKKIDKAIKYVKAILDK